MLSPLSAVIDWPANEVVTTKMVDIGDSVSCLLLRDLTDPSLSLYLIGSSSNTNRERPIAFYKVYYNMILAAPCS